MLSPADHRLVERDPLLARLATVLDPQAMTRCVRAVPALASVRGITPTYVRYKPATSCLVAYRVETDLGLQVFHVKTYPSAARPKLAKAEKHSGIPLEDGLVLFLFPHDRRLSSLGAVASTGTPELPAALRHALGPGALTLHPIGYKPERRFVARVDRDGTPVALLKCHAPSGFARLPHTIPVTGGGLHLQQVLARSAQPGLVLSEWIEGKLLPQVLTERPCASVLVDVGAALAVLHRLPTTDLRRRTAMDDRASLASIGTDLCALAPERAGSINELVDRINRDLHATHDARTAAIHGDFYASQVLVGGPEVVFLDLDELVAGNAMADLALFIAYLERDALRGTFPHAAIAGATDLLLRGYEGSGGTIDRAQLSIHVAESLVRLAPHPFRHREPQWDVRMWELLHRAAELSERAGTTQQQFPASRIPDTEDARRLARDPVLAFAVPLLDPEIATCALGERAGMNGPVPALRVVDARLLRHKVGRRCLLAFDVVVDGSSHAAPEAWLGKIRARGTDRQSFLAHAALWTNGFSAASADGISVPEPLGIVERFHLVLQRRVDAEPVIDALIAGEPGLTERLAALMRKLHRTEPAVMRHHTLDRELAILDQRLAALSSARPELAPELALVLDAARDMGAGLGSRPVNCIHRDLHPDQILLGRDGRLWLVDLDLASRGDPALDVGNFLAHLLELSVRRPSQAPALVAAARAIETHYDAADEQGTRAALPVYTFLALARLIAVSDVLEDRRPWTLPLLQFCLGAVSTARRNASPAMLQVAIC